MTTSAVVVAALATLVTVLSATTTAMVRGTGAVRVLELADDEVRGADALLWLVERPITTHRVSAAVTVIAAVTFGLTLPLPDVAAALATLLIALVAAPLLALAVVRRGAEPVGLLLAPLVRPVVRAVSEPLEALAARGRRTDDDDVDDADDEGSSDEDTVLDAGERRMILSILELDETTAREIMVPRPDVIAVPADATFQLVLDTALEHGRSRLPVHDPEDPDAVVGVVHARDLFAHLRQDPGSLAGGPSTWAGLIREPYHVPESRRADDLLRDLQAAAVHLALVVDEYGEVVGVVTIEDVLEEIVGEIVDEHDDERPVIEQVAEGRWRVDGGMNVSDLGDAVGVELPDEAWDTVGGLVVGMLGRLPRVGDRVEVDGIAVTVTVRRGRRVVEVAVERLQPAVSDAG
jgi:CBS domain containing-hemolysin-like protein